MSDIRTYAGIFPYIGGLFALLVIARLVRDFITPYDDNEQMQKGNVAATIDRAGAYVGIALAMSGSLIGSSKNYWTDFGSFLLDGVVAIAFFAAATFVLDYVVLRKVDNASQLEAGNKAVAMVQMSVYLALGIIMLASFSGGGTKGTGQGLLSALLFSALGLFVLMVCYTLFNLLLGRATDGNIRMGNIETALDVSSLLLGMGIALGFSISGDFVGWAKDIKSFAVVVPFAVLAIILGRVLANLLVPAALRGKASNKAEAILRASATLVTGLIAGLVIL